MHYKIRFKSLILIIFTTLIACPVFWAQSFQPSINSDLEFIYKSVDGYELKIWVFNPSASSKEKTPAMLFFYGGGWNGGTPAQFVKYCQYLAKCGMVGIVADYRVKSRHGTQAKSCVEDALDALRYVRENADKLAIDPHKIGVGGGSAGGHLAGSLGTIYAKDPAAPKLMALFNPVTILAPISPSLIKTPEISNIIDNINVGARAKQEQLRKRLGVEPIELSPYHHVSKESPPTIIFHGTKDKTVSYESALLFEMHLKQIGVPVELRTYVGVGHGFFNREPYFSQTAQELGSFLQNLGWL